MKNDQVGLYVRFAGKSGNVLMWTTKNQLFQLMRGLPDGTTIFGRVSSLPINYKGSAVIATKRNRKKRTR